MTRIRPLSEASARLVAHAREARHDDTRWRAVADALAAERHPLGEYLALSLRLRCGDSAVVARLEAVARAWRARHAPWARLFAWWDIGLVLTVRDLESAYAHVDDLRAIGLPLVLEIPRGREASDVCTFDDAFTRLAWMRKSTTVENASFGPGLDEEVHHWRDVVVWRVADRAELFGARGVEAGWIAVEVRGDSVYALGAEPAAETVLGACRPAP